MSQTPHLLLLAGSAEAREVAAQLAQSDLQVTASLALPGHWAGDLAVPTRTGGFGGAAGFQHYLEAAAVTAVLDATHPFAARISARSWALCRDQGLPYLQLDRPPWTPAPGDSWTHCATVAEAVALTQPGQRLFLTTGRESLPALQSVTDRRIFLRKLGEDDGTNTPPHVQIVPGAGPFSEAEEIALFQDLGIDVLIAKNAGGTLSRTKLNAALALGLPVILINRPAPTGAPVVRSVKEALSWVHQTCR